MKKLYFISILFVLCGVSVFGNYENREEVDFLLFSPNSGNRFVNEEQALIQLNNLAQYLSEKKLNPGQIVVYGYAAHAPNNVKADDLSKDRALFVMDELQKRGVSKELFSDPVGYGAVNQWGNNADENARKLNRRVRVLLNDDFPIHITPEIILEEASITETGNHIIIQKEPITPKYNPKYTPQKAGFKFNLWLLPVLPLLAFAVIYLFLRNRSQKQAVRGGTANKEQPVPKVDIAPLLVPVPEPAPAPAQTGITWTVNLDEEIRLRAYELSQERDGSGDYRDHDWYRAILEISAWYTACGHTVSYEGGYWWASRSYNW